MAEKRVAAHHEEYEEDRNGPAISKMHIDPEEPRAEATAGKYRPRIEPRYQQPYRGARGNGGEYHYQYWLQETNR